jgi:drug/metabolite transporter (DMT)-like permease
VLCAAFTAINIVLVRKCKDVHFSVILLHYSLWSLVFSLGLLLLDEPFTTGGSLLNADLTQWTWAVVMGVLGLAGNTLLVRALNLEGAGKVAVVRSLQIVMAFGLQVRKNTLT